MARVTPEQFQEKHARRLKAALPDMEAGVNRVTESPTLKAAAKKDKMRAGINAAIDSGKWERGLKRVSLEDWKGNMINKGIGRVAAGIDAASDKVRNFASELLPHIDTGVSSVKKMPDVTLEDSINRMTSFTRHMAKFQRRG
jgi:hypothetical protein